MIKFDPIDLDCRVELPLDFTELVNYITEKEGQIKDLKPGNAARILWATGKSEKTPYALVYLHGFSASHHEGYPVHIDVAERYGMNIYLSRLYDHGRKDTNSFRDLTPQDYYKSAVEALEIGKMIGDSIILMSCSTGSTLASILSHRYPEIAAHIMYSPNFAVANPASSLILKPWGRQITKLYLKGEYQRLNYPKDAPRFWNDIYHMNGIFVVKYLTEKYINDALFSKFDRPVFIGCYYKNENEQDDAVSVKAMRDFIEKIQTPASKKKLIAFPETGAHVIVSPIFSKDIEGPRDSTFAFIENTLKIKPLE